MSFFPFIQPNKSARIPVRPTSRGFMGQQVVQTRKQYNVYHIIRYSYDIISSRQYRILDNHFRSVNGGVTSFWVVDWGDPRPISAISGDRITINNVQGFSANTGDGGNKVLLWQNSGDFGNECTISGQVLTDRKKAWTVNEWQSHRFMDSIGAESYIASNTVNTLTITGATPIAGAYDIYRNASNLVSNIDTGLRKLFMSASPGMVYTTPLEKFVLPVYECFYAQDSLGLEQLDDFNYEPNDNYGPYYSGTIEFIQSGTGT